MNANDILDMVGEAKGSYVWDAQQVRSSQSVSASKRASLGRIWLIAAIVALMLLLMGCAWMVMRLQDLKVGEFHYNDNLYDDNGNLISTEEKTNELISLQNAHQDALEEWLEYLDKYDQDGSLLAANDHNESDIPETYHLTYNCYTWEMVEKLDEIVDKYDLQLLTKEVDLQHYEHQVLFDALNIDSLFVEDAPISIDYGTSYFYPEGTFDTDLLITLTNKPMYGDIPISLRYSLKTYFDPVTGSLGKDSTQWNYTRPDGTELLLVMDEDSARIYVDQKEAFISINMMTSSMKVPMTKQLLEEIAELFDFSIKSQPADMVIVAQLLEKARSEYEAAQTAKQNALYNNGYAAFIEQELERIENSHYPNTVQHMMYTLIDINGDGTEELITRTHSFLTAIVSAKNGESFLYYSPTNLPALPEFHICEDNVFEIYDSSSGSHYYFKAEEDGPSFIVGLVTSKNLWYRTFDVPSGDEYTWDLGNVTAEEVADVIASYRRIEVDWTPILEFPLQ